MTNNETAVILHMLAAAYRVELDDDTVATWQDQFSLDEFGLCSDAARQLISTNAWFPKPAELRVVITHLQREQRKSDLIRARRLAAFRCDGSRWIESDSGVHPCPTCNPALFALAEADKLGAYAHGDYKTHDTVEMPPCTKRDFERVVSFAEGIEIARNAYVAECMEQGREVNMHHFSKTLGERV